MKKRQPQDDDDHDQDQEEEEDEQNDRSRPHPPMTTTTTTTTTTLDTVVDDDTIRILLSTDNHLGYNERDPIRGMDSFAAFEEVLYLAKKFHCDMVLIAGDLFHENRPSRRTLFKTMEIIRRYCMGDHPVKIQILSDPKKNFPSSLDGVVNYQDPNYSIDLPIFSIHGNHDDPIRDSANGEALAALDLLAICNLVNYFGKSEKIDQVEISPVLIQKGTTKVALYGLGSMRDERLNRMWNTKKVRFLRPEQPDDKNQRQDDDNDDNNEGFFNIFTLHQNRDVGRGSKNCVQENMIPDWMDIVVWGHEHECLIDFFESVVGTFRITQPGSTVATSLVSGEAAIKKVGILDIKGKQFRMDAIPLTQVRSFVVTEVSLKDHKSNLDPHDAKVDDKIIRVLEEEVRLMTLNARDKRKAIIEAARLAGSDAGTNDKNGPLKVTMEKPNEVLVRIRVEHSGFSTLSNQRFGARFVGEVANADDVLLFHRKKEMKAPRQAATKTLATPLPPDELVNIDIEDLVNTYLSDAPERKLKLLGEKELGEAMEDFVTKNTPGAISDAAVQMLKKSQSALIKRTGVHGTTQMGKAGEGRELLRKENAQPTNDDNQDGAEQPSLVSMGNVQNSKSQGDDAMEEDEESEEEVIPQAKRGAKPARSSSKATKAGSADLKRSNGRRKAAVEIADTNEGTQKASKARPKRASSSKRVKYNFGDDDDDDDDGDESVAVLDDDDGDILDIDSDEEEQPSKKPRKTQPKKGSQKPGRKPSSSSTASSSNRGNKRSSTTRMSLDDDSDDNDPAYMGSTADLDDNWGSAATRL